MAKLNKTCTVCNTKYSFCPNCAADNSKPSWMNMFCSENCKNLFQAATDFYAGELTPGKAKAVVEKADLSNKANFKPSVVKFIDELADVEADYSADAEPVVEAVGQLVSEINQVVEEVKAEEVKTDSEPSDEVVEVSVEPVEGVDDNADKKPYTKRNKRNKFNEE